MLYQRGASALRTGRPPAQHQALLTLRPTVHASSSHAQRRGQLRSVGKSANEPEASKPPVDPKSDATRGPQADGASNAAAGPAPSAEAPLPWWHPSALWAALLRRIARLLNNALLRATLLLAFIVTIISGVVNLALVPVANTSLLPQWQETASSATQRKVRLGRVHGVSLAGVTGCVPLLTIGPCSVGPGPEEKSSLIAPDGVCVYIDPLTSLIQQQVVLTVAIHRPQVSIVQGDGFSWLGYPEDTEPSSRDLFPGLTQDAQALGSADAAPSSAVGTQDQPEGEGEGEGGLPPVAVGRVSLSEGQVAVLVQSERVPRYLEGVRGSLTLGKHYRSLDLFLEAEAHTRHVSSLKCTLVSPTAKRHLRHVTEGAASPPPLRFGCDVLPSSPLPTFTLKHIHGSAGHISPTDTDTDQYSSVSGLPVVSVHDMVRPKRGRQLELAASEGLPESYTLTSYGPLMSDSEAREAERAEGAHETALRTGEPHVWPDAPWIAHSAAGGATHDTDSKPGPVKPQGGQLSVRLTAQHVGVPDIWPDMTVTIRANSLHAPLVERILELPMDIQEGTLSGELKIRVYDTKSWQFPELYGRVKCSDGSVHFWDASDDLHQCHMELVFERDRVYLHRARGWYGAIPMTVTGDLDLNPETGAYRLSATVLPHVEVNALRATLGVRPTPQPLCGAVRGILHCTGALEHPVFSGTAVGVTLPRDALMATELTPARTALLNTPAAVGVFDRVPVLAANAVFTLDTATQRFNLHSGQVMPLGGGQLSSQGYMLVSPEAETDPRAINVAYEASNLDVGTLLACYLPTEVKDQLPTGALNSLGQAQLRGKMQGPHTGPHVSVQASMAPDSRLLVGASASFSPTAMCFTAQGPALAVDTAVHISTPHIAALRAANTQTEASFWARPRFEGLDLSASLHELDLLPLTRTATAPTLDPVSTGQPLRARCTGSVRCSLRPTVTAGPPPQSRPGRGAKPTVTGLAVTHPSLMFTGGIQLSSMRINNLEVIKQVSGQLGLTGVGKLLCYARSAPLASSLVNTPQPQNTRTGNAEPEVVEVEMSVQDLLPELNLDPIWVAQAAARASAQESDEVCDSRVRVTRGDLLLDAASANGGREYRLALGGVQLDELEAGSLRGALSTATLEANVEARQGRATLELDALKYASLAAERISSSVRWERDVVKLEETVLVQHGSRYELEGEVFVPDLLPGEGPVTTPHTQPSPPAPTPATATTPPLSHPLTDQQGDEDSSPSSASAAGRWRLAVNVPAARIEDLLPATQLLSATQQAGQDYAVAKAGFLEAVQEAGIRATLASPAGLPMAALTAAVGGSSRGLDGAASGALPAGTGQGVQGGGGGTSAVLPALQELSGSWMGRIQVWGDVQGASNVEFNLQGREWRWGPWRVDRISAVGTADSEEGVSLEELSCVSGPAKACLKGALLGSRQDASLSVTNFPLTMLQPLYSALPPALQGVQPQPGQVAGILRPFSSLSRRLESSMARLTTRLLGEPAELLREGVAGGRELPGARDAGAGLEGGPFSGLVFMDGRLGGSLSAPESHLDVRVDQGAVGTVRLNKATAQLSVDQRQQVTASVHIQPADMGGEVALRGTLAGHTDPDPHPTTNTQPTQPAQQQQPRSAPSDRPIDASLSVRDGGWAVLCALNPALQWNSGNATLDVRVGGTLAAPRASGAVHMSHVSLTSAALKHPVTNLKADVQFTGRHMVVNTLDARVGRTGRVAVSGTLPLLLAPSPPPPPPSDAGVSDKDISLVMENIDLRVANVYSGALDSELLIEGAVLAPVVGGRVTFSRGSLNLQPPASSSAPTTATGTASALLSAQTAQDTQQYDSGPLHTPTAAESADALLVRSAFSLLRAGRKHAALVAATGAIDAPQTSTGSVLHPPPAPSAPCQLSELQIVFGPELRASFPVVLNVAVSGQVSLSGPADMRLLSPSGAIILDSGTLNLVATQFVLDRDHTNRILFFPESGLTDPTLDIVLLSGDLRAVLAGRASAWPDVLSLNVAGSPLTSGAPAQAPGVSGVPGQWDPLKPQERPAGPVPATQPELTEMAQVFEDRLTEALLRENGQLALRNLASSTLHTLLPKLETRGQLGAARWRLVGAPSLPSLLGVLDTASSPPLDPTATDDTLDPAKLLSRLAVGTELELMWGDSLVAALQHKLLSDSKIGTEARLTLRITNHLRLNLQLQGLTYPSLTLGYTSDLL